jgi:hypothetical protein
MGGYAGIPLIIMVYFLVRIGILYGRKIPLIFIALLIIGRFTLPEMLGPYRFEIFVACLAIILAVIDRVKSVPWNSM